MLHPDVEAIVGRVPEWRGALNIETERMGGLTNANYRVEVDGRRYAVRISAANAAGLGIDRRHEGEVLRAAATIGVGPELVSFLEPEGHLVTRFIEGRHWTAGEYFDPANLDRLVDVLRRVHALPPVEARFSAFDRVEAFIAKARDLPSPFPEDFPVFLAEMDRLRALQARDSEPWLGLCHNDLYYVNILDDGGVRLIDWEFAGMGDVYFDLATLVYAWESSAELPPPLQDRILLRYFGEAGPARRARFQGMRFMLRFFTAMWAVVQEGSLRAGLIPPAEGFAFGEYADEVFAGMRGLLARPD
jgi:thiamine kinase-like enzyme